MRRMLITLALGLVIGIIAACAPTTPAPAPAVPVAKPPTAPVAPSAPASQPATAPSTGGVVVQTLGREYLAYPKTKGTIRFMNCWGGARIPLIEAWIKDFNTIYPDIKVVNDTQDCNKMLQTMVTQIAGGDAPDVAMVQSQNFPFLSKDSTLVALDDLIKRDKVDPAWYYEPEWNQRVYNGKLYGIPNVTAGAVNLMYYNTMLLEKIGWNPAKPPATWQDLEGMVEPAKKNNLFVLDIGARWQTGETALAALIYSNGGAYWTDDLKKVTVNSPEAIAAAEWELKFAKAQAGKYENLIAATNRNTVEPTTWGQQKYVLAFSLSAFAFQLNQQVPQLKYAIAPFPRNASNPNSKGYTLVEGGWSFSIPKNAKNQDAAWEWIKFTTASKAACDFVAAQSRPSPTKMCNEDPRLKNSTPYWNVIQDALNQARPVPLTDIHPQFQDIFVQAEDNILFEKMTPKEALDKAATDAQKLLDEWNKTKK